MARVVAQRGYDNTRVADVLEEARMSRRTFYRLFRDREECFLAAYDEARRGVEGTLPFQRAKSRAEWRRHLEEVLTILTRAFAVDPCRAHLLLVAPLGAGSPGRLRHEQTMQRMALLLARSQPATPTTASVPHEAAIGAVLRVMQVRVMSGEAHRLPSLAGELADVIDRIVPLQPA
jgi:AcrR family transcriptional regulator